MSYPQMPRPDTQPTNTAPPVDLDPALRIMDRNLENIQGLVREAVTQLANARTSVTAWEENLAKARAQELALVEAINRLKAGA